MQRHGRERLSARDDVEPRFFGYLRLSRQRILGREYHRDKDGKFASGGGAVRDALAGATSVRQLNAAAIDEARRITGRDIHIEMSGDLGTAKEHLEGVMRGLERFPGANLQRVDVGDTGTAWAHVVGGTHMTFSDVHSSAAGRQEYLSKLHESVKGWDEPPQVYGINTLKVAAFHVRNADTPMSVALHEMGHVVHLGIQPFGIEGGRVGAAVDSLVKRATANEQRRKNPSFPGDRVVDSADMVQRSISGYARTNRKELVAEAFADVAVNGSSASRLSQGIYSILQSEYPAPSNRTGRFFAYVQMSRQRGAN